MRGEAPGARREVDADISADRPEVDLPAPIAQRREPQAQMVTLMDRIARLLEAGVLTAPEHIERAHRCIPVAATEQEGFERSPGRAGAERLGDLPIAGDKRTADLVAVPDQDEVDRVSVAGAVAPRGVRR